MRAKAINTELFKYLLSGCSVGVYKITFWSCSLKKGHDHIFKATGLVFTSCGSIGL